MTASTNFALLQLHADRLYEGELETADRAQLETMLDADDEARVFYLLYCDLHSQLHAIADMQSGGAPVEAASVDEAAAAPAKAASLPAANLLAMPHYVSLFSAAAILAVCLAVLAWMRVPWQESKPTPSKLAAQPASPPARPTAAKLRQLHACAWEPGQTTVRPGMALSQGMQLALTRGAAELEFQCGARVLVQGPARFEIADKMRGRLLHGTITALVPSEAIGFEIETPRETIVDLGTEFGVDVDWERGTEVVVLVGSVAVKRHTMPDSAAQPAADALQPLNLSAGEAVWVDASGNVERAPADERATRYARSMGEYRDALLTEFMAQADPVVYFRMNRLDDNRLFDEVSQSFPAALNWTANDDASWPAGRLDDALQFDSARGARFARVSPGAIGDAIEFSRGSQTAHPFSISLWVQSEPGQADGAGLIARGGGLQEQFAIDVSGGRYRFFTRNANGLTVDTISDASPNGEWQHLVGTFDPTRTRMSLWMNGKLQKSRTFPESYASLLASGDDILLGSRQGIDDATWLSFDGKLDEVAIFPRALTREEIQSLYKKGL